MHGNKLHFFTERMTLEQGVEQYRAPEQLYKLLIQILVKDIEKNVSLFTASILEPHFTSPSTNFAEKRVPKFKHIPALQHSHQHACAE